MQNSAFKNKARQEGCHLHWCHCQLDHITHESTLLFLVLFSNLDEWLSVMLVRLEISNILHIKHIQPQGAEKILNKIAKPFSNNFIGLKCMLGDLDEIIDRRA